ncbi:hypothetical protein C1645_814944 [Glomus cerebriforme]|uniref:Uncharacterized protein n=1 Tax=Glomus cerebriforme TaxID=658196 RepID=A0A397TPG3_9GLOM|nr:hypothetical protein C1645_814944 [Glomus cerebriforme]
MPCNLNAICYIDQYNETLGKSSFVVTAVGIIISQHQNINMFVHIVAFYPKEESRNMHTESKIYRANISWDQAYRALKENLYNVCTYRECTYGGLTVIRNCDLERFKKGDIIRVQGRFSIIETEMVALDICVLSLDEEDLPRSSLSVVLVGTASDNSETNDDKITLNLNAREYIDNQHNRDFDM